MPKKSLLETNPYLRNPAKRKEMLFQTIVSSSAIEGIRVTKRMATVGRAIINNAVAARKKKSA